MPSRRRHENIPPESLWRQELLGTIAVYQVRKTRDDLVEVEVKTAPGLTPGTVLTLTRAAVLAMHPIDRWP